MLERRLTTQELDQFLTEFQKESDRAAAVLGGAYLETRLELLLRRKFVAMPRFVDDLFSGQGGLASFSGKISIAFAIGLISRRAADDLHIVRRIRNDFAHQIHGISFKTKKIADLVDNFGVIRALTDEKGKAFPTPTDARQRFNGAVASLLVNEIEKRRREMPKFNEAALFRELAEGFSKG